MRILPLLVALVPVLALAACAPGEPPSQPPQSPVTSALARGVNLSTWFVDRSGYPSHTERFETDPADLRWIAERGLKHLRVPFDPSNLLGGETADALGGPGMDKLRRLVDAANQAVLAVVLSFQPPPAAKQRIASDSRARAAAACFWSLLAAEFADRPVNRIIFEALNEPEIEDAELSRKVVGELADAIRAAAPRHSIVVSGHRWSSIPELLAMRPYADRNRIYSFHFYDPHNFTHQGADWGWEMWQKLAGLPYPSSPAGVNGLLELLPAETHPHLLHYGEQRWNRARLAKELDRAADWARQHRVFLWCSEFGVYKYQVAAEDRQRWLRDVRTLLEERKMGWSHWAYAGGFGMVSGKPGERETDAALLNALGLRGEQQ